MAKRDEQFWAAFLGTSPSAFRSAGVSVCAHGAPVPLASLPPQRTLRGYHGVWSFRHGPSVIVSAPPPLVPELEKLTHGATPEELLDADWWSSRLSSVARVIGPAYQGMLEHGHFRPHADQRIELRDDDLEPALADFKSQFDDASWSDSGLKECIALALLREQGRIIAAAGYRPWGDQSGDPCILVHPEARGQGCGTAVTSAILTWALSRDHHLLFQTLESNAPSVAIARKLGYQQFATYLAIRLRDDVTAAPEPTD